VFENKLQCTNWIILPFLSHKVKKPRIQWKTVFIDKVRGCTVLKKKSAARSEDSRQQRNSSFKTGDFTAYFLLHLTDFRMLLAWNERTCNPNIRNYCLYSDWIMYSEVRCYNLILVSIPIAYELQRIAFRLRMELCAIKCTPH